MMMTDQRDERDGEHVERARRRLFTGALAAAALGAVATGLGFVFSQEQVDDVATGFGVLAGAGFAVTLAAIVMAWLHRPGTTARNPEAEPLKRDRLLAERARQLWIFPLVTLAFLGQSTFAVRDILDGEGGPGRYLIALLPVVYAWLVAAIAMGWGYQSRIHRHWLDDELTQALRARALGAAFIVTMAGTTLAFVLGLWRLEIGVAALPFVLAAGGATAGIRFAWLDREFGKDG